MRGPGTLILRVVLLLTLVSAVSGGAPYAATAQDDATRFANALAAREESASLAGPLAGELTQTEGFVNTHVAGVTVDSFIATALFANPDFPGTLPWDVGFAFHRTPDTVQQIVVDSNGNWFYSPWPAGTLQSGVVAFDSSPGGMNSLELVVDGRSALFGVNGEFVASIPLPPSVAADVEVGTSFFTDTTEDGRVIPYSDFQVWSLSAAPEAGSGATTEPGPAGTTPQLPPLAEILGPILAPSGTPEAGTPEAGTPEAPTTPDVEPTATAAGTEPATTVSSDDAALFAAVLADQEGAAPLAGPFNANLKEIEANYSASWADVNLSEFHARAVFDAPEMPSEVPWDFGVVFGTTPNGTLRIAADSLGSVWYSVGVATPENVGSAPAIATQPGQSNSLDLLVAGGRAMLGVNGELVASVILPPDTGPGDVAITTALYSDQTLVDRVTAFHEFVILPLAADALAAGVEPVDVPSAADAEEFQAFLAATSGDLPIAGPYSGRLVEATIGTVPLAPAGVSVSEFGAVARLVNPAGPAQELWDAGFQFRGNELERSRVVIDSLGDVYADISGLGTTKVGSALWYNANPGATNTLQLFVVGERALFGVNNQFVTAVDLGATPITGDVSVGAGFFNEDFVVGRVTDYQDFAVWEVD